MVWEWSWGVESGGDTRGVGWRARGEGDRKEEGKRRGWVPLSSKESRDL